MKIPNAAAARNAGGDETAPAGTHIMRIKNLREKNGRLLLLWEVVTGPHQGAIAWDGYSLDNPKACGLLIRRLEGLGVEIDENGFFDEASVTGKLGEVQLVQNDRFINVKNVSAVDPATATQLTLPLPDESADEDVPF